MHTKLPHISFFSKNSSFFVAWFSKNSRNKFLNQEFYGQLLEQAWSNGLFDPFKNRAPRGTKAFFIQMVPRWKWAFVGITKNDHQFFRESYYQKLGNIFFIIFALTLWSWHLFPFLEISTKFIMTKGIQNKFIHFMRMLTSKQSLHFSISAFTNENIHNKNCP